MSNITGASTKMMVLIATSAVIEPPTLSIILSANSSSLSFPDSHCILYADGWLSSSHSSSVDVVSEYATVASFCAAFAASAESVAACCFDLLSTIVVRGV